jgi:predicted nucleic acid-binding protein
MMRSSLIAVIDTCSIFPQTLRDVLLRAAEAGLYRLRWTEEILDELGRNLQEDRGLSEEQTKHLLTEMRRSFPEATVTGHERLIGSMTNHPADRHVLAAAVQSGAQVIVTDNLKDFPEETLSPFNIETQSSDEFLEFLLDRHPDEMAQVIIDSNAARRKPPEDLSSTLARLARSAPRFAARLRENSSMAPQLERLTVEDIVPKVEELIEGDFPPSAVAALFIETLGSVLAVSDITPLHVEAPTGTVLYVAVVDAARRPDFADLHSHHHGKETQIKACKWRMFGKRQCAYLLIESGAPVFGSFVLEFAGPARLRLAVEINRLGRIATISRMPVSEADIQAAGLVWTFPFSPIADASLTTMIQQSTQGSVGTT